ncbi:hypothetical protein [Burkholderia glumae]
MKCSACGSDHTQRLSAICEAGTTQTLGQRGSSQTVLAQKLAPPAKAKPAMAGLWIVVGGIGLFLLIMAFATSGQRGAVSPLLGLLFFIPSVVMIVRGMGRAKKYNETTWKENYEVWLKAWYCHKCGEIYD